jgi:polyphosphate glucokinase
LRRLGRKKWQKHVEFGTARLIQALNPDDVVLGGGNAKKLKKLPPGCRAGNNANAFIGGFRLWENAHDRRRPARAPSPSSRVTINDDEPLQGPITEPMRRRSHSWNSQ